MNVKIQLISILGSVLIMMVVFWLIRKGRLREEYSFLWFGASAGLIALSLWRDSLEILADLFGVAYPPSVLLLAAIVLGFFVALHYSMSLSRLADQNKRLAQEVALLRHDFELAATAPRQVEDSPERPGAERPSAEHPDNWSGTRLGRA